ncbi:MAG: NAD-dependent epimerase/dehydratase family protein [Novosphingobium sp.]|jgi:dihydroflavonol-4-reductase|uniref:NAD-dependent epimerase/dehydratase family protein n=1 Tax=Novosphingobium sp. TaxID=1874826 RepID=UPI001E11DD67|nr:NAD-dependent epimerase/dehydratase family protein [Novosphingobium sp.]MCB2057583.1 NAD-dependent epimerase/dehydratase family protein [Novosphingobium sp.]MCP5386718.1 NAD-dependent epimerase/dehydratase family protein [Novosphingobium sp.]
MAGTVFVSGGSGYIAGFLIRQLVAEGWIVHTTIRNLAREGQVRESLGVDNSRVKFFAADLTSDAGWDEAMAGCSHVAHLASPLPTDAPSHEDELIVPARDGALRALRAARAAGIKRFVMTSSMAAVAYGHGGAKTRFTEADWTNIDSPDAYAYVKSKTIAERAARDWVAAEGGDMEFCTVNPVLVLGPLQSADFSTSLEAIKKMLEGSLPGLPRFGFGVVDVRDVADMHLRCLTAPDMAGERFLCSGPFLWMREIAEILRAGLGDQARKVPRRGLPDWLVRVSAWFDPVVRQVIGELGHERDADTGHALAKLGWKARPVEETVLDTARDMIRLGIVKV